MVDAGRSTARRSSFPANASLAGDRDIEREGAVRREAQAELAEHGRLCPFHTRPTLNSVRPLHTVEPLAQTWSIEIEVSFRNEEEAALAASVSARDGVVLISRKRDGLPTLSNALTGDQTTCPNYGRKIDSMSSGYFTG